MGHMYQCIASVHILSQRLKCLIGVVNLQSEVREQSSPMSYFICNELNGFLWGIAHRNDSQHCCGVLGHGSWNSTTTLVVAPCGFTAGVISYPDTRRWEHRVFISRSD